jgi:hypothetical protein
MPALGFAAADIGGFAAADIGAAGAVDAGALGVLDAGLVGGAVPGAIAADVGAADVLGGGALGLGGAADVGLGVSDLASTGALGADALGAIGAETGAFGSAAGAVPGLEATLTPGAVSLGGGASAAVPATGGGAFSAGQALEAAANPEDLLAISGGGGLGGGGGLAAGGAPSITGIPGALDVASLGESDAGLFSGGAGGAGISTGVGATAPGAGGGLDITSPGNLAGANLSPQLTSPWQPPASPIGGGGGAAAAGGDGGLAGAVAAPVSTVPAAGGGSASAGGLFGTGISGKDALLYGAAGAPLALAMFRGEPGVPPQANQATALSPAEQAYAQQIISTGGAPNRYQAAQIAQNSQARLNAARQQLFNMGVQNPQQDSRWAEIVAQDQQQQMVETVAFQNANMQSALAAAGGAQQGLLSVAQMQAQQDAAYTQALQNAMGSAGRVLALGGAFGNKVQPTVSI